MKEFDDLEEIEIETFDAYEDEDEDENIDNIDDEDEEDLEDEDEDMNVLDFDEDDEELEDEDIAECTEEELTLEHASIVDDIRMAQSDLRELSITKGLLEQKIALLSATKEETLEVEALAQTLEELENDDEISSMDDPSPVI